MVPRSRSVILGRLEGKDLHRDIAGGVDAAHERHRPSAERLLDDAAELILERVLKEHRALRSL